MIISRKENNRINLRNVIIIVFAIVGIIYMLMVIIAYNNMDNQTYNITIITLESHLYKVVKSESLVRQPDVFIEYDSFLRQSTHNFVYVTNNISSKSIILSSVVNGTMIATKIPYENKLYDSKYSLFTTENVKMYIINNDSYYVIGVIESIEKSFIELLLCIVILLVIIIFVMFIYTNEQDIPKNVLVGSISVKIIILLVSIISQYYGKVIVIILTVLFIIDFFIGIIYDSPSYYDYY